MVFIILPIGLCIRACAEASRDDDRPQRQPRVVVRRTVVRRQVPGQPGQTGGPQPGSQNTITENWSGHFSDDKGTMYPMTATITFDYNRGQFAGVGKESGFDFTIADGWMRENNVITFTKTVAGHKASFTGKHTGTEMKGMWYISGYDQTGGQFSLVKQ